MYWIIDCIILALVGMRRAACTCISHDIFTFCTQGGLAPQVLFSHIILTFCTIAALVLQCYYRLLCCSSRGKCDITTENWPPSVSFSHINNFHFDITSEPVLSLAWNLPLNWYIDGALVTTQSCRSQEEWIWVVVVFIVVFVIIVFIIILNIKSVIHT